MKILIIRNFPTYIDVEKNTYNIQEIGLAKALIRKGHNADIVFWTDKEEKEIIINFDGDKKLTIYYKKGLTFLKNTIFKIDELIKQYDIIQTCEYNQIQSWLYSKKYKNKHFIYHGPYYAKFNKRYNFACKIFDTFFLERYKKMGTQFLVKSNMAAEFLARKGIERKNIVVTGVGLDLQMMNSNENCDYNILKRMNNDNNVIKLLYVGKIEPRRNPYLLLSILEELNRRNVNSNLYIVGNGNKDYVSKFFEYVKNLKLSDKVVWEKVCEQQYMTYIYKKADYFLLPTEYEIFGMVISEAMHNGCITLTTLNGGSSTLIDNNEDGIIIDNCLDFNKWADEIIKIENDKILKEKIRKNAAKKITKNFTWDKLTNKFILEYEKKREKYENKF